MKSLILLIFLASSAFAGSPGFDTDEQLPDLGDGVVIGNDDGDWARLAISGYVGCGQSARVVLAKCETDFDGYPLMFGCDLYGQTTINQTVNVEPGSYYAYFNNSRHPELIHLEEGDDEVIELTPLNLGQVPYGTTAYVFRDLSIRSEQVSLATEAWSSAAYQDYYDSVCEQSYKIVCDGWNRGPEGMVQTQYQFLTTGQVQSAFLSNYGIQYSQPEYVYVHNGGTSGFVSVFPGTYGVAYVRGGRIINYQLGIEVR